MSNRFSVRTVEERVSRERTAEEAAVGLSERSVLIVALAVEGVLILVATVGAWLSGQSLFTLLFRDAGVGSTAAGVALAGGLFLLNCIFLLRGVRTLPALDQLYEFNRCYVVPLARTLSLQGALIVSLLAGFGEELFFRAFLQPFVGIFFSGALFAALHFGKLAVRFPLVFVLYFGMSCLFGWVYEATGSIWTVCVAHVTYDFVVLTYVRRNHHRFANPLAQKTSEINVC